MSSVVEDADSQSRPYSSFGHINGEEIDKVREMFRSFEEKLTFFANDYKIESSRCFLDLTH